jgi:hypothetical protein
VFGKKGVESMENRIEALEKKVAELEAILKENFAIQPEVEIKADEDSLLEHISGAKISLREATKQ